MISTYLLTQKDIEQQIIKYIFTQDNTIGFQSGKLLSDVLIQQNDSWQIMAYNIRTLDRM